MKMNYSVSENHYIMYMIYKPWTSNSARTFRTSLLDRVSKCPFSSPTVSWLNSSVLLKYRNRSAVGFSEECSCASNSLNWPVGMSLLARLSQFPTGLLAESRLSAIPSNKDGLLSNRSTTKAVSLKSAKSINLTNKCNENLQGDWS